MTPGVRIVQVVKNGYEFGKLEEFCKKTMKNNFFPTKQPVRNKSYIYNFGNPSLTFSTHLQRKTV